MKYLYPNNQYYYEGADEDTLLQSYKRRKVFHNQELTREMLKEFPLQR